jgi:hypothetical protein
MAQQGRIHDLEREVELLRSHLAQAKGVNDTMWDTIVQRLVEHGKISEEVDENKRNRKRNRTGI